MATNSIENIGILNPLQSFFHNQWFPLILALLIIWTSVTIAVLWIQSAHGESKNITVAIDNKELFWCYNTKGEVSCNMMVVDENDKFRLLSSFLEYLNSGIIEIEK